MQRDALFPKAKELRKAGKTFQFIAHELHVGERTVRLWFATEKKAQHAVAAPAPSSWPAERSFPDEWTIAEIARRTGWDSAFSARLVRATHRLQREGKMWAPWFVRLWVEHSERWRDPLAWQPYPGPLAGLPEWVQRPSGPVMNPRRQWQSMVQKTATLVAGLEVLEEWLPETACGRLRLLVTEQKPFLSDVVLEWANWLRSENRINPAATKREKAQGERLISWYQSARKSYGASARTHVADIRQKVEDLDLRILLALPVGTQSDPTPALIEIANRLPMMHATNPLGGPGPEAPPMIAQTVDLSRLELWQLFVQVLVEPLQGGAK